MKYQIIQPPFTLKFREMGKEELKEYYKWFMAVMPNRIAQLEKIINIPRRKRRGIKPSHESMLPTE